MAELADALDLGSSPGKPGWGFDSPYSHHPGLLISQGFRGTFPVEASRGRLTALACVVFAGLFAPNCAFSLDETEEMLMRARHGLAPTPRHMELARKYLEEWRDSERVGVMPGDQSIGRTFEAIAEGRRLGPEELGTAARLEYDYREGRARRAAGGLPPVNVDWIGAPGEAPRPPMSRRRLAAICFIGAAGLAVVGAGTIWIYARQRLRKR